MSSERRAPARGARLLLCLAVALVAGLFPSSALDAPFLLDDLNATQSPDLRGPGGYLPLFRRGYWEGVSGTRAGDQYRPLTMVSYRLNLGWLGDRPADFRLVNFALHGLSAGLVALLAIELFGSLGAGLLAGLLHGLLPVHADTVVGVAFRGDLLAAALALLAVSLHGRAIGRARLPWAAAAAYGLAVLAKESAAALPAALLLLDRSREPAAPWTARAVAARYGPHLAALGAVLALRVAVLGQVGLAAGARYFEDQGLVVRALTMARFATFHYLRPLLLGRPLLLDFSRQSVPDASPGDAVAWLLLAAWVGGAGAALGLGWWRRSAIASCLGAAVLLALPVANLVVRTGIVGAHRVLYLPAVGVCLAAAGLAAFLARRGRLPRVATIAVAAVALLLAARPFAARARLWRQPVELLRHDLALVPGNALLNDQLGYLLAERGDNRAALAHFRAALAATPGAFAPSMNASAALEALGQPDEALAVLEAVRAETALRQAAVGYRRATLLLGRPDPRARARAVAEARRAVELLPANLLYRLTLAEALVAAGDTAAAVAELRQIAALPARTALDGRARAAAAENLRALAP